MRGNFRYEVLPEGMHCPSWSPCGPASGLQRSFSSHSFLHNSTDPYEASDSDAAHTITKIQSHNNNGRRGGREYGPGKLAERTGWAHTTWVWGAKLTKESVRLLWQLNALQVPKHDNLPAFLKAQRAAHYLQKGSSPLRLHTLPSCTLQDGIMSSLLHAVRNGCASRPSAMHQCTCPGLTRADIKRLNAVYYVPSI